MDHSDLKQEKKRENTFPVDWLTFRLGELGETYGGLTGKTKEDFCKGNAKFIPYMNVYKNYVVDINQLENVNIKPTEKQNLVRYGDILFTSSSETADEVGMSSVFLDHIDNLYLNSFCFGYRPNLSKINPNFAAYLFRSSEFRKGIFKLAQGSTRFNLSKKSLMDLKILIPKSLDEQQKIAEILSTVDEQIEITDQLINKTKELKKGLMQQLLTKGIGHTEFKQTEFGEIPVEWEIKTLGSMTEIIMGQSPSSSTYNVEGKGLPFYQGKSEFGNKYPLPKKWCIQPLKICEENDILFSVRAPVGEVNICQEKSCIGRGLAAIRVKKEKTNHWFLYFALKQAKSRFDSLSTGSTFQAINSGELKEFQLVFPPLKEQQKIAEILSTVDEQIEAYEQEKEKYTQLKKGLMQQLLTGKIRVKV